MELKDLTPREAAEELAQNHQWKSPDEIEERIINISDGNGYVDYKGKLGGTMAEAFVKTFHLRVSGIGPDIHSENADADIRIWFDEMNQAPISKDTAETLLDAFESTNDEELEDALYRAIEAGGYNVKTEVTHRLE